MKDFLKSAKKARAAGDLEGAGDFLLLAGRHREAVDTFIAGGFLIRAAEVREKWGDLRGAAELYVQAGDPKAAAEVFEALGDLARASELMDQAGETYKAAQLAERAGLYLPAAARYQETGDLDRAADLYSKGGDSLKAAELYEELWLSKDRETPRHGVRSLLTPARISDLGGQAFLAAGQFEQAAAFFARGGHHERAAEAFDEAALPMKAARAYRRAGRGSAAIEILSRKEADHESQKLLGELYQEAGEFGLAGKAYEDAGELREAAVAYEQSGDLRRAAALHALVGNKRKAADLFHKTGDLMAAARAYEEADRLDAAVNAYEEAGHMERAAQLALRSYEEAKDSQGTTGRARLLALGKRAADLARAASEEERAAGLYAEIGLVGDAAACFEECGLLKEAADQLVRLGDYPKAAKMYEAAEIEPPPEVKAGALETAGKPFEAAQWFEKAGDTEKAALLYNRAGHSEEAARLLEATGQLIRAAEMYIEAGNPAQAGDIYQRAGMLSEAASSFETACLPDKAAYVYLVDEDFLSAARVFIGAGKEDDALVLLQKIQKDNPTFQESCLLLGDLFFHKELYSLALDKYYQGLKERMVTAELLGSVYNLSRTYEKLDRSSEARACYERILAVDYSFEDAKERHAKLRQADPGNAAGPTASQEESSSQATQGESRFEVKGMLLQDSLGTVYRGWDRELDRPVMIRRFEGGDREPNRVERFIREAKACKQLRHPHVLTVYDAGTDAGTPFVAMEYVDGGSLRKQMAPGVGIDPYRAADLVAQTATALDHAHRNGILHRSLRPETILVLSSGDVVKIHSFGFVDRITDILRGPESGREALAYMSPEQVLGKKLDERSDCYAIGTILYELLFGRPPFQKARPSDQVMRPVTFPKPETTNIPGHFQKVIRKCLDKDPDKRYQSAKEIADELQRTEIVPGTLIEGRYEIQAEIGKGGMGKVYRARDRELDEIVALKLLKADLTENSDALARFLREIKLARKISHPNVVKVYDMGRFRGSRFISMEFIDGPPLDRWIKERSSISIKAAIAVVRPILSALAAAHRLGIVHRDIKPQNVLLAAGTKPKLVDFGIARGIDSESVTLSGEVLGSPKYMSPEHIEEGVVDLRSDLYAVGILLYLLTTGKEPFRGENPTSILLKHLNEAPKPPHRLNKSIPRWLDQLILKCLVKDPENRYQSANAILGDLDKGGKE